MGREPHIEERSAQPYVGIPITVTMDGLPKAVDAGFPEMFWWLREHGVGRARVAPTRWSP